MERMLKNNVFQQKGGKFMMKGCFSELDFDNNFLSGIVQTCRIFCGDKWTGEFAQQIKITATSHFLHNSPSVTFYAKHN